MAKKEEAQAPKKTVTFTVGDGKAPVKDGASFKLRSPLALKIDPNTKAVVKLGVSANAPVLVFEAASLKQRGLRLAGGQLTAADAGEQISVTLENTSRLPALIEMGDVVAKAVVLDNSDLDLA